MFLRWTVESRKWELWLIDVARENAVYIAETNNYDILFFFIKLFILIIVLMAQVNNSIVLIKNQIA